MIIISNKISDQTDYCAAYNKGWYLISSQNFQEIENSLTPVDLKENQLDKGEFVLESSNIELDDL